MVSWPQRSQKTEGKRGPDLWKHFSLHNFHSAHLTWIFMPWLQAGCAQNPQGLLLSKQLCRSISPAISALTAGHPRLSLKEEIAHSLTDCSRHSALWNTSFPQGFINLGTGEHVIPFCRQEANKKADLGIQNQSLALNVQSKEQRARVYKVKVINILGDILIQKQTNNNFPRFTSFSKAKLCCRKILPTPQSQLEADTPYR